MATNYSPKIPTDGLIMSLDAANPKSFLSRVEVLVVAGGGGGGMDMGGGGGGGGVVYSQSYALSTVTGGITVTVGNGGTGAPAGGSGGQPGGHQFTISATAGQNSVFDNITAIGGGYGASSYWGYTPNYGQAGNGGSGGGASGYSDGTGNGGVAGAGGRYGTGTAGQGNRGGGGTGQYYAGGGGGAGGIGGEGTAHYSAAGGSGVRCDILGIPLYWGGGGGGASYSVYGGPGGIGGGGGGAVGPANNPGGAGYNDGGYGTAGCTVCWAQVPGGNGGANTGGGGGGGSHYNATNAGGNGGSGIVIVKYPGAPKATGGTIVQSGGSTLHIFLSSGTFTPNTWKDTINNYDATFTSSPSWSSANGGVFVTTSGGGRATVTGLNLSGTGTHTIIGASRYTTGSGGRIISSINNNWLLGQWSNYIDPFYAEGWVYNASIGNDQAWRIYAASGDTVNDVWKFYINGVLKANNSAGSAGPNGLQIGGYGGTNELTDGHCGFVMAYNRVLSDEEIYNVFLAHRGRFGI